MRNLISQFKKVNQEKGIRKQFKYWRKPHVQNIYIIEEGFNLDQVKNTLTKKGKFTVEKINIKQEENKNGLIYS